MRDNAKTPPRCLWTDGEGGPGRRRKPGVGGNGAPILIDREGVGRRRSHGPVAVMLAHEGGHGLNITGLEIEGDHFYDSLLTHSGTTISTVGS